MKGMKDKRRWKKIIKCSSNSTGSMGMWYSNISSSRMMKSAMSFAIAARVALSGAEMGWVVD